VHTFVCFRGEGVHHDQNAVWWTTEHKPRADAVTFEHSRRIHDRAWLAEHQFTRYAKDITTSLTGRDIEHIPMVLFRRDRQTFFTGDKRLEQPDGGTVNVASNESDPNTLVPSQTLQIIDESVSFPLRGPDLALSPTRNRTSEIPCDPLMSSDHSWERDEPWAPREANERDSPNRPTILPQR